MNQNNLNVLVVQFTNELKQTNIPYFRGAVIAALGEQADVLFHNHTENGFRYAYPLIQYKRVKGKAAIVCIKDGTEQIGRFFADADMDLRIGNTQMKMEIETIRPHKITVQVWDTMFKYRIRRWLPLNSQNYKEYMLLEGLKEKIAFLERILTGNLLSFTKGVDVFLDKEVLCELTSVSEPFYIINKGVKLMAFDVEFKANLSIPDYVGIGKNASIGCGVITRVIDKDKIEK